jgi:hypothetical protein
MNFRKITLILIMALSVITGSCNKKHSLPTIPVSEPTRAVFVGTATRTATLMVATCTTTPTITVTVTATPFRSATPAFTFTVTPVITFTQTQTNTPFLTCTPSATNTPMLSPTASPTITVTCTATTYYPAGNASVAPSFAIMNSGGNTLGITYSAGGQTWATAPGYGTLKITVPQGFSAPSMNTADPGYFTVNVTNGVLFSALVNGMDIIIKARDLTMLTGTITVNYGSRIGGGAGATVPVSEGQPVFNVEMTSSGDVTTPLEVQPSIDITGPLGSVVISPLSVAQGSSGNDIQLVYTADSSWVPGPSYGTLKIQVPAGFSQPSLNPFDPGYFSVGVVNGTLYQTTTDGSNIFVNASSLPSGSGQIIIDYGSRAGSGPGATAPGAVADYTFYTEADRSGTNTHPLAVQPVLKVGNQTQTVTPTFTITATITITYSISPTPTISTTSTRTPTITKTAVSTKTITPTITLTKTISPTPTITRTFTVSMTITFTFTDTISQTPTPTKTITPTFTITLTRTNTPTITPVKTSTSTKTITPTRTPTFTVTNTITPTATVTMTATAHVVTFADHNLESAVRAAVNIPTGNIMSSDMTGFTTLNAYSDNITDLSGLEECYDMTILSLYSNSITDITPLSGLTKLNYVDLNNNSVADITALVTNSNNGGIAGGAQVFLTNNPLSAQAVNSDIPYLTAKGVTVAH